MKPIKEHNSHVCFPYHGELREFIVNKILLADMKEPMPANEIMPVHSSNFL
jgi:hypothetical protein